MSNILKIRSFIFELCSDVTQLQKYTGNNIQQKIVNSILQTTSKLAYEAAATILTKDKRKLVMNGICKMT